MNANDRTYNGWTNYETWSVNLFLTDDDVTMMVIDGHVQDACEVAADIDEARRKMAEVLKDMVEEANPLADGEPSVYQQLLAGALSECDWYEVAEKFIDAETFAAYNATEVVR